MKKISFCGWCFALFLVVMASQVSGQKKIPYISSFDSITVGAAYADTGAYALAIRAYESVSPYDTNYTLALLEDALAKESAEQDSDAIAICMKGLQEENEYNPDFYNVLASTYMDEGNYSDAEKILQDSALKKFSNLHKLYYTLGLAQYKMHKYSDAITSFQKSIDLDIYDALSHYYLGRCCLEQGRLIPALLSLQFYLVLQPQANRSYTAVGLIEKMVQNKYQYNKLYAVDPSEYHDSVFTELDLLIRSKIAMNKEYKSSVKINYNFEKQIQLLFEQLKYIPSTGNYWMEKYVPFFTGDVQKKFFEPYLYYILSSINDEDLQKDVLKNTKKMKKFSEWADKFLMAQRSKKEIEVNGKKTWVACYYFDNNMIQSMGPENSAGKSNGDWTFYYRHSGKIYSQGKYNISGERDGKWQWFYNNGAHKETTNFINGKKEGIAELWYENGAPKAKYTFHNDMFDGDCWEYNISGILTAKTTYKEDKIIGSATYYYDNGKQHFLANYSNGKFDGELKEFYPTGQVKSVKNMQNDLKNGAYLFYWPNGKVEDEGQYKEDIQTGHWKVYTKDGSLQKEGDFNLKGSPIGRWVFYYRNGKKEEVQPFNKDGQLDGMDSVFDKDGIEYKELFYKNDILQRYTFKDKSGSVISSGKIDGKNLNMVSYNADGIKNHEGLYVDNMSQGEWDYYNYFGKLTTKEHYYNDKLDGVKITYYGNGNVQDSLSYADGEKDGYYVGYHINGVMETQGWYVEGEKQGDWLYYDLKGNLIKHNFYVNGSLSGCSRFFESNGKLSEEHYFKNGYIDKIYDYDTNGRAIYKYVSDKGNGKFQLPYSNGNIVHELNYVNGELDGTEKKYYYNGKLSKEGEYLLDQRQGATKAYYENGNVKYIYDYLMGTCEGTGNSYFENGNLEATGNYYDDNLDGVYKLYYESGKLDAVSNYVEGDHEGEYKSYYGDSVVSGIFWFHEGNILAYSSADKDGKSVKRIQLDKGSGDVTTYFPNGNKAIVCTYKNGYVDGKRINYMPDGKINSDENFITGYANGIQKYYYEGSAVLKEEDNYYYGELDGICTYYYKDGSVEHTETYSLGTREGPSKYYDKGGSLIKTDTYFDGYVIAETASK